MKSQKQNSASVFAVLLTGLMLSACGESFTTAAPTTPASTMPSQQLSSMNIPGQGLADGMSATEIILTIMSNAGTPVSGVTLQVSVSGQGNVIVPCTPSNANGVSRCKVYSTRAETKTINIFGAIKFSQQVVFAQKAPSASIVAIVSSGGLMAASNGQFAIAASGIVEGPMAVRDAANVVRLQSSVLSVVAE